MVLSKKKRVSKRNKKSWRKNVDLKDVDNFLEDQRLEERLGLKYADKKSEDLFEIDTVGANESVATQAKVPVYKQIATSKAKSLRLRETETPKCFEALYKRSAVPGHFINKTKKRKADGTSIAAKEIIKKKLVKNVEKAKNILKSKPKSKPKEKQFNYDVWSTEDNDKNLDGCSEWLSNDVVRHTLHNTGKCKRQMPNTLKTKTSLLPAIEEPHPGLSYNPSLKDHTKLLEKAAETEIKLIEEEKHLDRVTTKMFKKIPREKLEKQYFAEMTVGLSMAKTESDEEDEDDGEFKSVNPPAKNKKKSERKRRKLKEQRLLQQKLKEQKVEKKKIADIYKLRKFNEMINKKEEKIAKNIERHKELKKKKAFMTKKLSQTKYEEPKLNFHLAEELSGNLRNVKPEGDILLDRFKSLQKRNILQPTVKRKVKKRKVKKYERAHTKMGWEPKGYVPFEDKKPNEE